MSLGLSRDQAYGLLRRRRGPSLWNVRWGSGMSVGVGLLCCKVILSLFARRVCLASRLVLGDACAFYRSVLFAFLLSFRYRGT
jgi:hypothetical protein